MLTTYNVLKTIHVLAAVTWVGGAITLNLLAARLSKADARALAAIAKEMDVIVKRLFLPSSLVLLVLGIWMVSISSWDFSDLWIAIGIAGILVTALTGSLVFGPQLKKIGLAMERGATETEVRDDIVRLFALARIDLVVLVLVIVDMVMKPGA